jgi:hypothetical protein
VRNLPKDTKVYTSCKIPRTLKTPPKINQGRLKQIKPKETKETTKENIQQNK